MPTPDASAYTRQRRLGALGANANNFGANAYQFVPSGIRLPVFLPSIANRPTTPFVYRGINTTQRPKKNAPAINVPQSVSLPLSLYISTIAGDGTPAFSGDGLDAEGAQLNLPYGVCVDSAGNIYIADRDNSRIRKIDTAGIITTVAGTGDLGFSGDGGAATSAWLNYPTGVCVDTVGNIYIADSFNSRIRKVDASSKIITTFAGSATSGFSGDGSAATLAKLTLPTGIFMHPSGSLYIADTNNHRIRKVDTSGVITTVAGSALSGFLGDGSAATAARLNGPTGVFVDSSFNIYIADRDNNRVRKVTDSTGNIATIAGRSGTPYGDDGGQATLARLRNPSGVFVDSGGSVLIADFNNNRVRKVDQSTGIITTIAGTGVFGYDSDGIDPTTKKLNGPTGVFADSAGNVYIADQYNNRIRKIYYQ